METLVVSFKYCIICSAIKNFPHCTLRWNMKPEQETSGSVQKSANGKEKYLLTIKFSPNFGVILWPSHFRSSWLKKYKTIVIRKVRPYWRPSSFSIQIKQWNSRYLMLLLHSLWEVLFSKRYHSENHGEIRGDFALPASPGPCMHSALRENRISDKNMLLSEVFPSFRIQRIMGEN